MSRAVVRGIWLTACLALGGCSVVQPHTLRIDAAAGMYQVAAITYRVDAGQLSEPLTVARISGQRVAEERLPSSTYPDRSVARLSIQYPHPGGKVGYALAEMVVETHAPPTHETEVKKASWQQWIDAVASTAQDIMPGIKLSDGVYEAWTMDIAKRDVDRVIAGMSQSGYFVNPSKPTLGVELSVRVDNFQAVKRWTREGELDVLMDRVRRQGQLVSYVHPFDSGRPATVAAAGQHSTVVWHEAAGPSLAPAGPQNNAYSNPAPPTQAPSALPAPAVRSYPPTPARVMPRSPAPPGYRRPAAPRGPQPPAANLPATQRGPLSPLQRMLRMPWRRATSPQPAAQPPVPDPRRPRMPRYGGQQPPPGGRASPQYRRPAMNPPPKGRYPYPQINPAPAGGGYPAGFPPARPGSAAAY